MSEPPTYTIYKPETDAPQVGTSIECRVIGTIRTPCRRIEDCPSRHNKRECLPCTIQLAPEYAPGLAGLEPGVRVLVLYWLHLARRDIVQLPARPGVRDKPVGVFFLAHAAAPEPHRRGSGRNPCCSRG